MEENKPERSRNEGLRQEEPQRAGASAQSCPGDRGPVAGPEETLRAAAGLTHAWRKLSRRLEWREGQWLEKAQISWQCAEGFGGSYTG